MMAAELAIIIPTKGRSHLLSELLASIVRSTTVPYRVYFVVERDDHDARPTESFTVATIRGQFGSYVKAANAGVELSREPFFIIANDDVLFHVGWDLAAFAHMKGNTQVVGVDQGNGRCDCFFLIDRCYITDHGGCGTPGQLYDEGYESQYCDTEVYERARRLGIWGETHQGLIEHKHWTLGKAGMDDNYQRAVGSLERDRAHFTERQRAWLAPST